MAQPTADKPLTWEIHGDEFDTDLPVAASSVIYAGSLVGKASGYFRQLVAADVFGGVALIGSNNGSGAAGAANVHVRATGTLVASVAGVTGVTDEGATVYASDGNTLTLTSASNTPVGKIIRHISGTSVAVRIEAAAQRSI